MQKTFMDQMQENQKKQMEEMNKNLTELRERNKFLEKQFNDLAKEVRGFKDAVSEHTDRSNRD